jgi:hypothetical protein
MAIFKMRFCSEMGASLIPQDGLLGLAFGRAGARRRYRMNTLIVDLLDFNLQLRSVRIECGVET